VFQHALLGDVDPATFSAGLRAILATSLSSAPAAPSR
jgi:hypothetical protein